MKLIVGLGNPGKRYKNTRHNVGFFAIDTLAHCFDTTIKKRRFNSRYGTAHIQHESVILAKPLTYMNKSGIAVSKLVEYYQISVTNELLVIFDDVQLPFGKMRVRRQGSAGGHNGLQSIIENLGTQAFARLRIGINKPPPDVTLTSYVLSELPAAELMQLPATITKLEDIVKCWVAMGIEAVMQRFN